MTPPSDALRRLARCVCEEGMNLWPGDDGVLPFVFIPQGWVDGKVA
jgi:hypothetical protein